MQVKAVEMVGEAVVAVGRVEASREEVEADADHVNNLALEQE